ncbi:Protein ALP1-like [Bienertia sinuspersici]
MSHDQQVSTIRKRTRDDNSDGTEDEMELIAIHNNLPWNEHERAFKRAYWLDSLMNDRICKVQLRMDRRCFDKLCHVLVTRGGLVTTGNVTFHIVLKVVIKIGKFYIRQLDSSVRYDRNSKWKWFEGSLGALDGTLIKMTVQVEHRPKYRDRKGDITTNVLATCDPSSQFTYVWSGNALRRPNGLKVPRDKYFLIDFGYSNTQGFLAPYNGTRYHLNLWRGTNPTNYKELFNLHHSSVRNTIERAFGLFKKTWAILRRSSFYDKRTRVRIINVCFVLNNLVREENLDEENLLYEVDNDLSNVEGVDKVENEGENFISMAQVSPKWNNFIDEMARKVMNNKRKESMASMQAIKRGYVSWNKQMDNILTRVLLEEINNKEKGDGDFKPQAYQTVVDELKKELGITINVDHVRNRTNIRRRTMVTSHTLGLAQCLSWMTKRK